MNICNINEATIQTQETFILHNRINKLFLEGNYSQDTEARKVAGSATYKQSKTEKNALSIRPVCLFSLFSHENKEILFIWFV